MGFRLIPSTKMQDENRNRLHTLATQTIDLPTRQVPGMNDLQKTGQSLAGKYINADMSGGVTNAIEQLNKTVGGGYDPLTSSEYKGYRELSKLEEENAVNALRRRGQISGVGASTPILSQEGRVRRGFSGDRMSMAGQLLNRERDRMIDATGRLIQAEDYAAYDPVRKAAVASEYGDQQRDIETEREDAIYNTLMAEVLAPYTYQVPISQALIDEPRYYYKKKKKSGLGGIAGSIAGGIIGGPAGAQIGGAIGSQF